MDKKYFVAYCVVGIGAYGRAEVTRRGPISSIQDIEEIELALEKAHAGSKEQGKVLIMSWQLFEELA